MPTCTSVDCDCPATPGPSTDGTATIYSDSDSAGRRRMSPTCPHATCACPATTSTTTDGQTRHVDTDGRIHHPHAPAYIYPTGAHGWYRHGTLHRSDGPALDHPNGTHRWRTNGAQVTAATVTTTWLAHHHHDATPALRDLLINLANAWPHGSTLERLYGLALTATRA